ncbi:E3 ubiquitin-protein ligase RSL1 [Ziziphus jujuba]|uniref:RBR-type E3 ubiquitin transferase n=1 Tax=Ziziphus jujuba TaxID=326968 RepID=A0A6P3ZIJ2_ZIZJJ|nr:E3 ubiquitin-protein ligase RSL1 [Ziziphus jujuba]
MEVKADEVDGNKTGLRKLKKPKLDLGGIEVIDIEDDDQNSVSQIFKPINIIEQSTNKFNAISIDHYSNFIDLSNENDDDDDDDDDIKILHYKPSNTTFGRKRKKPFSNPSILGTGQSSNSKEETTSSSSSSIFICEICIELKSGNESFTIKGCGHLYCTDCTTKYVASKLQQNILTIGCPIPGCVGNLEPEYCRRSLPPEVFDRWGMALCEAAIVGSRKFYCPYKDCLAVMICDGDKRKVLRESECPYCKRHFCAKCRVPWHTGIECSKFQKLDENERENEDITLMKLAKKKRWGRCPKCRFYVEKTEGCDHMNCRCGTHFNYRSGK